MEVELYGLYGSSNGRYCERHAVCGECVVVGDILRLKRTVVKINDKLEHAIKFVNIVDGCEKCTVGFVSKSLIDEYLCQINEFFEVVEIYREASNSFKRRKSCINKGMALCRKIDVPGEINTYEV